jgi:hypothetical protein
MAYLNSPIPVIEAYVRGNFLRDQKDSFDKKFPCFIFGVATIPGQAPLFHFVMEDGGMWWRMPIHAFCWKEDAPDHELDELVLWDSFSYHVTSTQFPYLKNKVMKFISRRRKEYSGRYLFTLDWASSTDSGDTDYLFSEYPSQHKCGHVIMMDDGNFAIQPNNRLKLHDPSFTVKSDLVIDRMYNRTLWTAERNSRWVTPDTEVMNYDHTDLAAGESNEERSKLYNENINENTIQPSKRNVPR